MTEKETLIDMPDNSDMKAEAMKEAKWAVDNIKVQYKMSKHIKEKFDEKYGPNWHCCVAMNLRIIYSSIKDNQLFFYIRQVDDSQFEFFHKFKN